MLHYPHHGELLYIQLVNLLYTFKSFWICCNLQHVVQK